MKKLSIIAALLLSSTIYAGTTTTTSGVVSTNCVSTTSGNVSCRVQLVEGIDGPSTYYELGKLIETLKEGDVIRINVNGPGGRVDGLGYLYNKIKASKGKVIMVVDGDVASADAAIALSSDYIVLPAQAYWLFHAASSTNMTEQICTSSKGELDRGKDAYSVCVKYMNEITNIYNKLMVRTYEKVLTKEEIASLLKGETIVLSNDEVKERLLKNNTINIVE